VAAGGGLVEVGEVGVDLLSPAARGREDLAGERRDADRELHLGAGLPGGGVPALPVQPGGGGPGARQPVQGDVVQHMVPGEVARGLVVEERAGDLVVAVGVVVKHPGRQRDRRIQQGVADRLRPGGLLLEVGGAGRLEGLDRGERGAFRGGAGGHARDTAQRLAQEVQVDAEQPGGCLAAHRVGDGGALVAALGHVPGVPEAVHQLRPGARDAAGVPAVLGRVGGEAVAGQRRHHQVERVLGGAAVRDRVGERADDLEHLDDRAWPAVRDDQRQRVLVPGLDVDEVNVQSVDLGDELRQRVQLRLAPAPVVVGGPVAGELLDRGQLHALRPVPDEFPGGPARRGDAPPQAGDRFPGYVDPEWPDISVVRHNVDPFVMARYLRSGRRPARTSAEKMCGCSQAAK